MSQTALMYGEVERCFNNAAVSAYFDKSWLTHTQLKASAYEIEAMAQVGVTQGFICCPLSLWRVILHLDVPNRVTSGARGHGKAEYLAPSFP